MTKNQKLIIAVLALSLVGILVCICMGVIVLHNIFSIELSPAIPTYIPQPTYTPYPTQVPPTAIAHVTSIVTDKGSFLEANGFVRSPENDYQCNSPCKNYINATYSEVAIIFDNGGTTIGLVLGNTSINAGQTNLLQTVLDQFYGPDMFHWVADNMILVINKGYQDSIIDDYPVSMQLSNGGSMFVIVILPAL